MSSTTKVLMRCTCLFTIGSFFALVLNVLQVHRKGPDFQPTIFNNLFSTPWWVVPIFGTFSAVIGFLYPFCDKKLGEKQSDHREWSTVMRCVAVFVGINHLSAKIDFANHIQFSLTLAALSIGLWWSFDRSKSGFGLGVIIAVLTTFITQFLVYQDVYRCTDSDFLYVRALLPCVFFSGGVTIGNIGRQLAIYDSCEKKDLHEHND